MVASKAIVESGRGYEIKHKPERTILLEAISENFDTGHFTAASSALDQLVRHCENLVPPQRNEVLTRIKDIKALASSRQTKELGTIYAHRKDLDTLVQKLEKAVQTIEAMPASQNRSAETTQQSLTWGSIKAIMNQRFL